MKKTWAAICCGMLTLTLIACGDDEKKPVPATESGTITIDGTVRQVVSALYAVQPGDEFDEGGVLLMLLPQQVTTEPATEPDFYVMAGVCESYLGREVDLSKPLSTPAYERYPFIGIAAPGWMLNVDDTSCDIFLDNAEMPSNLTVTKGSVRLDRTGDQLTLKLDIELSDGKMVAAAWSGTAIEVPMGDL